MNCIITRIIFLGVFFLLSPAVVLHAAGEAAGQGKKADAAAQTTAKKTAAEGINHGPYLVNMTDSSVEIIWTTSMPCLSWVEIAPDDGTHFYAAERKQYFDSPYGQKRIGNFHRIRIDGLTAGTRYRYRIFSTEVLHQKYPQCHYGRTFSTKVYRADPPSFKTFNPSAKSVRFVMVNDIHQDAERMKALLSPAIGNVDFILLNGDMLNHIPSEDKIFEAFMDGLVKQTNSSIPIVFARGNHETRGDSSESFMKYFPTPTGKPYFSFKVGGVLFVVLDSGEDKPDSDIEYSNRANFDEFRQKQMQWLKTLVESPKFKSEKCKILICHIPPAWGKWHGSLHFRNLFSPLLSKKNFSLILSGHLHNEKDLLLEADKDGISIPNVVNGNMQAADVEISERKIDISFRNVKGEILNKRSFDIN